MAITAQPMTIEQASRITAARVAQLVNDNGRAMRAMRKLLADSLKEVEARVATMRAKGIGDARFSQVQAKALAVQIRQSIDDLTVRMEGLRAATVRSAARKGIVDMIRQLKGLERHYRGVAVPLRVEQAAQFRGLVNGVSRSIMRDHPLSSVRAYGMPLVEHWETYLSRSVMAGTPFGEVLDRVTAAAQTPGLLQGDNYDDPTFERWRAERIIRTETLSSYNGARQRAMEGSVDDVPNLMKQVREHKDGRTAWDSMTVDGQVRPLGGFFEDGAGHVFAYPPSRPNDRGWVLPWSPDWGIPGNLGGPLWIPGGPDPSRRKRKGGKRRRR